MLKIIVIMLAGIALGYLLRNRRLRFISALTTVAIWLLLFLLGITVGTNRTIIDNLTTIGWQAFVLAVGGVGGSVILAWGVYKVFFKADSNG